MNTKLELSEDAVTVVALAGTALAYANSVDDEVERWLRALGQYGEAGMALSALGIDENRPAGEAPGPASALPEDGDRVGAVLTAAEEFAHQRGVPVVGTVDLLLATMRVYGQSFDRALAARETDRAELVEYLDECEPRVEATP
jgi:hypothetical protein